MEYFAKIKLNEDSLQKYNAEHNDTMSKDSYVRQEFNWMKNSGIELVDLATFNVNDAMDAYKVYLMNYAMNFDSTALPMTYSTYLKRFRGQKDEIDILYAVLKKLKIEDVALSWTDTLELVAEDADNEWRGKSFYEFLSNEAFVYNADGSVLGVPDALYSQYLEIAETYNISGSEKERAKYYIKLYVEEELNSSAMLDCTSQIPIGYTTAEDGEYEVQACADLETFRVYTMIDDIIVRERKYNTLAELIERELVNLSYDELVAVDEDEIRYAKTKLSQTSFSVAQEFSVDVPGGKLEVIKVMDPEYPGVDVCFVPDVESETALSTPRVLIERPKDGHLRALVWDDPNNEDYTYNIPLLSRRREVTLAERLIGFYKDYDLYDYRDSLEAGDTDEDAIKRTAEDLTNPDAVTLLLNDLKEIATDADLSSEQKTELESLMRELRKLQQC